MIEKTAENLVGSRHIYRCLPSTARDEIRKYARQLMVDSLDTVKSVKRLGLEKSGFVYVISNPAFPGYVKIGMAVEPHGRLASYQTSTPFRDYVLEHSVWVSDRRAAEREMFDYLDKLRVNGEWFQCEVPLAKMILGTVKESYL